MELWQRIIKHEASHLVSLKAGPCNLRRLLPPVEHWRV